MTLRVVCAVFAFAIVGTSVADGPVTAQDLPNNPPARPTPVRATIINAEQEAVPVHLVEGAEVRIVPGTGPIDVRLAPTGGPIEVRAARTAWDYRSVIAKAGADLGTALAGFGADGWEAAGIMADGSNVVILLKRPH